MLVAFSPVFVSDKCKFWLQFRSSFIKLAMFNCVSVQYATVKRRTWKYYFGETQAFLGKRFLKIIGVKEFRGT